MSTLTWPTSRMAKFIDVTPRRLQQLVQEGVIPKCEGRGRYNPVAVNLAYIRFLRDRATSPESSDSEFFAAKLAKLKSEREMIELQMQITRGERLPIVDVAQSEKMVLGMIRGTLIANHNKVLTKEILNEIFAEWRARAQELRELADNIKVDSNNGQIPSAKAEVAEIVKSFGE
jgi:hypothetical protein